ncbi:hypothetical protein BWP39_29160 [Paraburkholderia acidicola]|uniref:Uncharacterized protein n=2 Tax=Paraburkholderia acidicola TaxID=1912599 RepID=A0A2A4ERJ2_9BURK|nr:hypothetical protein BWP39_29160 [Paraburkholderia acidicola]
MERPSKAEVAPRAYEVSGRSVFVQQTGGSSLAVGLLLGAIVGGIANAVNTDRLTDLMGKSGAQSSLYTIDALTEAQTVWPAAKAASGDVSQIPGAVIVKPFVLLYQADEKSGMSIVVSARVESSRLSSDEHLKSWVGIYSYLVNDTIPLTALQDHLSNEQLDQYRASIRAGYSEIRSEMERDLNGGVPPKRQIAAVKSPALGAGVSPIMGIGLPGDIERSPSGRLSLRVSGKNFGMSKPLFSYAVFIFPSPEQYTFSIGPVDRE